MRPCWRLPPVMAAGDSGEPGASASGGKAKDRPADGAGPNGRSAALAAQPC